MSGDPGSDPTFTGVRQPSFDSLVTKHSSAGSQLESLASTLWTELSKAGLDTSPAVRIREIARRVSTQAEDLRRRQRLVHEMVRQKAGFGIGFCTPQGTYHAVPDRITDLMTKLDGRAAADLAKRAAGGDRNALAGLKKYASQAQNPQFAQAFLQALGPKGLVQLPATLAKQTRAALNKESLGEAEKFATDAKQALGMMSTALASGTDPKSAGYVGDSFLNQLKIQGRAEHRLDGLSYAGYQSLALVWRSHQGQPPYSPHFMKVAGRDAIVFERERLGNTWKASEDKFGQFFGSLKKGIPDLATVLDLGDALTPGRGARNDRGDEPFRSSMVDNLFHAASNSKEASQSLLDGKPAGWDQTVLTYMLTTRRDAFHDSKNYHPFQLALETALSGKDDDSTRLTNEALNAVKAEVGSCFGRDEKSGELVIADPEKLENLAFLRPPLGHAMAANIEKISGVYDDGTQGFSGISARELDLLLVHVTRDDRAFKGLLRAQADRMHAQIKGAYKHHDGKYVSSRVQPEAHLFGRLLEARRLALMSEGQQEWQAKADLQQTVREVVGLAATPSGSIAAKVLGSAGGGVETQVAGMGTNRLADWIISKMRQQSLSVGGAALGAKGDKDIVAGMIGDMIIASKVAHGKWSSEAVNDLEGKSFATGSKPPQIKPLESLSPEQFERLIRWARNHSDIEGTVRDANREMNDSGGYGVHENLGINRY